MEIRINAIDMVSILVKSGIEANSAKALVFDILSHQNGDKNTYLLQMENAEKRKQQSVQREPQREPQRQVQREPEYEEEEEQELTQVKYQDNQPQRRVVSNRSSNSGNNKMDFSTFGGDFKGLGNG